MKSSFDDNYAEAGVLVDIDCDPPAPWILVYICRICAALTTDIKTHDKWHGNGDPNK